MKNTKYNLNNQNNVKYDLMILINNKDMENRTDLAVELDIKTNNASANNINVDTQYITPHYARKYGFLSGDYTTITFDKINDHLKQAIKRELNKFLKDLDVTRILIVGLGNEKMVVDQIGPLTISKCEYKPNKELYFFNTGVLAQTGLESVSTVKALAGAVKPSLVIVIDAIVASDSKRLLKTIQINNAGIKPGSGINNDRPIISKKNIGVPVIGIGVPTAIMTATITEEVLSFMKNNRSLKKFNLVNIDDDLINELNLEITDILDNNLVVMTKDVQAFNDRFSVMLANILTTLV